LSVSFSEDWVSRTVLAVFIKGSTAYQVDVGTVADAGEVIRNVLIPSEVLTDADNTISFGFYSVMEGTSRLSTELGTFSVVDGAYRDGTTPTPPAPDIWEQLVQKAVPMIDPTTTNWMIWDMNLGKYVDTGFPSRSEKGDSGVGFTNLIEQGTNYKICDPSSTVLQSAEYSVTLGHNCTVLTFSCFASGDGCVAGKRAFKITAMPSTTSFTLDSVDGLAVGDVVSYSNIFSGSGTASAVWRESQDLSKITAISNTTITLDSDIYSLTPTDVNNFQSSTDRIACRLWVNAKPEIGTYDLSTKANARGRGCKALGDGSDVGGKDNVVTSPYGAAVNSSNRVDAESGFGFGSGNTLGWKAARSAVGGNKCVNNSYASLIGGNGSESPAGIRQVFGWGEHLEFSNDSEAAVGAYNKTKSNLRFSVGNGSDESHRSNALEVYKDGTVIIPKSFQQVAYVNSPQNTSGWYKFAHYNFSTYKSGSLLLDVCQGYAGDKFNSLFELEITTDDTGFHPQDGFVFRQIAGQDITDRICYYIDTATHDVDFYIRKTRYDYIFFTKLADTFGDLITYFTNVGPETLDSSITSVNPGNDFLVTKSFVNSSLNNYYNKTAVDSLLSSKSDKTAIVFIQNASSISFELGSNSDNKEFRIVDNVSSPTVLSQIGTATINVSIMNGSFNNDYITGLTFRTAATGTITMSYTGTGILQWVGTDCDVQDGYSVFTPQNSMTYDIVFYFNGARFVGLVNGYEELNVEK
jgi:hypothetical protein